MDVLENQEQWSDGYREWVAHYKTTGNVDWKLYPNIKNSNSPEGAGINLAAARLMLITSSGCYLKDSQKPFDTINVYGDYSVRSIPIATRFDELEYAHDHYDQSAIRQDTQVLLPFRFLEEMQADGKIGSLAENVISFMGYQPDVTIVTDKTAPAVLETALADKVTAALLVPS